MMKTTAFRASVIGLSTVVCTALVIGCGGDGFGARYPISGTVKYKGEPVSKGLITFHPTDQANGRAASGQITNGSYSLTTVSDDDGALPGDYKVSVSARHPDLSKAEAFQAKQGGSAKQDDIAQAMLTAKLEVPTKYELPETSGLVYKVEKRDSNVNFDLTD